MWKENMRRAGRFLKRNLGKIGYYAAVAAVLAAIAAAAGNYRESGAEELVLPAAEIQPEIALPAGPEIMLPEGMELIRAYSERPEWNAGFGMWEAHPAADYRLVDDAVTCLCAGTVRAVGKSGVHGGFVDVESGELLLRYASIEPLEGMEAGEELAAGEIIGNAVNGMPGEHELGNHLHLEVYENRESIDFEALAAKNRQNAD